MSLWVLCLLATLAGFVYVWRGIRRAELALGSCQANLAGVDTATAMTHELDAATREAGAHRVRLQTRVADES